LRKPPPTPFRGCEVAKMQSAALIDFFRRFARRYLRRCEAGARFLYFQRFASSQSHFAKMRRASSKTSSQPLRAKFAKRYSWRIFLIIRGAVRDVPDLNCHSRNTPSKVSTIDGLMAVPTALIMRLR